MLCEARFVDPSPALKRSNDHVLCPSPTRGEGSTCADLSASMQCSAFPSPLWERDAGTGVGTAQTRVRGPPRTAPQRFCSAFVSGRSGQGQRPAQCAPCPRRARSADAVRYDSARHVSRAYPHLVANASSTRTTLAYLGQLAGARASDKLAAAGQRCQWFPPDGSGKRQCLSRYGSSDYARRRPLKQSPPSILQDQLEPIPMPSIRLA